MKHTAATPLCHFERSEAESRNLPSESFLPVRNAVVPNRVGNPSQTVSRRQETQWSHVEQETLRKQFPAGMKRSGATPSRKPFAKSFLPVRNTVEPRRVGNPSRKVSCRQETQWSHVEQETLRKQFPAGKKHHSAKSSRKPFANSFLSIRNTMPLRPLCHFERSEAESRNLLSRSFLPVRNVTVSRRIGNYTRKVSCR